MTIQDFKITYQRNENDCGVACYKMILNHFNIKCHYQRAKLDLNHKKNNYSVSMLDLVDAFEKREFDTLPAHGVSIGRLIQLDVKENVLPAIVFMKGRYSIYLSYCVVDDVFWIVDPEIGLLPVPRKKFKFFFDGIVLLIQ